MKTLLQRLDNYWFSPMLPARLAFLRIATGGIALWYLLTRYDMLLRVVQSDHALFDPVGAAAWLSQPLSFGVFQVILWLTVGLNVGYILGWKYRITGPLFALIFLFIMSYRNSWSMLYHNYNGLVLHILVIGFTAAAHALSLDSKGKPAFEASRHFGWPVKLICTATVGTYLLSGIAKIQGDLTWAWASGSAMRSQVAVDALRKHVYAGEISSWFEWLYPHTAVFAIMGIATLLLELGAPVALFNKKIGWIWAVLTCGMHWGIYFIMGIEFPYHLSGLIFLSFFPLEKLSHGTWRSRWLAHPVVKAVPGS